MKTLCTRQITLSPQLGVYHAGRAGYAAKVLALGPLAYWPLLADAKDISGNGYNGDATNVVFSGSGAYFNGVNAFVNVYSAGLSAAFNGSAGTIAFAVSGVNWSDGAQRDPFVFTDAITYTNYVFMRKNVDSTLAFSYRRNGDAQKSVSTSGMPSSCHVAMTWDTSGYLRGYMNGASVGVAVALSGAWANQPALCTIGLGWGAYFAGTMKHFALFSRVLSGAEVASLAAGS